MFRDWVMVDIGVVEILPKRRKTENGKEQTRGGGNKKILVINCTRASDLPETMRQCQIGVLVYPQEWGSVDTGWGGFAREK